VYATVEKDETGRQYTRLIEREGPTGAIITTSKIRLDRDLETRLLRLRVDDSEEQTRAAIDELARKAAIGSRRPSDRTEWHSLWRWLWTLAPMRVRVPLAPAVAAKIPSVTVRLRRDVGQLFALVAAHAALHLVTRERDEAGFVLANYDDYEVVCGLVDELLGTGAGTSLPAWAQETWTAVPEQGDGVTFAALGRSLGIGTDADRDRALKLIELGHLANRETRPRAAAKLVRADPLPDDATFLPSGESVRAALEHTPTPTDPISRTEAGTSVAPGAVVRAEGPEPPHVHTANCGGLPEGSGAESGADRDARTVEPLASAGSDPSSEVESTSRETVIPGLRLDAATKEAFAAEIAAGSTPAQAADAIGLGPHISVSLAPWAPEIVRGVPYRLALEWERDGLVSPGTADIVASLNDNDASAWPRRGDQVARRNRHVSDSRD
jgi:hypothetical protein